MDNQSGVTGVGPGLSSARPCEACDDGENLPDTPTEAADWVVQLNTSENVAPLTPRFWEWLKAKPENRLDYSDLERIWRALIRHYRSHGQPLSFNARGDAELLGQRSAEVRKPQWDDDTAWPTPTIVSPITARWAWARPVRAGCVALLVAALVVAILPRFAQQMGFREGCPTLREQHQTGCRLSRGSFSNDSGDSSTLELVDGSEIVLHGNTQVTLDMSPLHRHIRLDRGTALFKVHKDSAAVFGVHVGDATVTAVGTIFSVGNKGQNGARVAVTLENVCTRSLFIGAGPCSQAPVEAIVDLRERNTAVLRTDGIDVTFGTNFETGTGRWGLGIAGTYVLHYKEADTPGAPLVSVLNTLSNPLALHSVATAKWEFRNAGVTLGIRYSNTLACDMPSTPELSARAPPQSLRSTPLVGGVRRGARRSSAG